MLTAVLRVQTPKPPRKFDSAAAHRILAHRSVGHGAARNQKRPSRTRPSSLGKAGASVREIKLPDAFNGLHRIARETIGFL